MVAAHLTLAWMIACSQPPTAAEIAARVLDDDIAGAAALAGDDGPLAQALAHHQALTLQQEAIAVVAGPRMRTAAERAVSGPEPLSAVVPVCTALELDPIGARSLADQLGQQLIQRAAADGLAALSSCDGGRWDAAVAAARPAAHARSTYGSGDSTGARARAQGVDRDTAVWVLETIDDNWVRTPDWASLTTAAETRLRAIAATTGPGGILGEGDLPPTPTVRERADALARLDSALAAWPSAPASLLIAEWTEALVSSLDPYSRVVWPSEVAAWENHHAGINLDPGLVLQDDAGALYVVDLALDGPAFKGGVHLGDELAQIGELNLDTLPAAQRLATAQSALAGPEDTTVDLVVQRSARPVHLTITHAPYRAEVVKGARRHPDNRWDPWIAPGIAYVRIDAFRPWVDEAFDALLDPHLDAVQAVILDLRGNAGGDVSAAVNVADRFVAGGHLADMAGRALPDTDPGVDPETGAALAAWNDAVPGHALEGVPVAVLVDRETASAAEILAGALQQRAHATIIGETTTGKAVSQRLIGGDNAALQLTNLRWTLPDGAGVEGGLRPDVLLRAGPGVRELLRSKRSTLRRPVVHADGSLATALPPTRPDLPPLAGDPVRARAVLWALARRIETP